MNDSATAAAPPGAATAAGAAEAVGPRPPSDRVLDAYASLCGLHARWFRYRVEGFAHLPERSSLICGYHGRPAYDMFMLMALIRRRRGRHVYGITHRAVIANPLTASLFRAFGLYAGDDAETAEIVRRGDHVAVLPGGTRECFRSSRVLYEVDWGRRRGYLRFALRHGLPIVPVASSGVDEFFRIYGDGYRNGMRFFGTDLLPLCLPLGLGGLPFPLGAPRPVHVRQHVGEPIELDGDPEDDDFLDAAHLRVTSAVQDLIEAARSGRGGAP